MEKQFLKSIIFTHKERFLAIDKLSARLVSQEDEEKLLSKEVVLLTGIRGSGKTSLLNLYYHFLSRKNRIPKNNILFINFKDERFIDFTVADFELLYRAYIEMAEPKGGKYFFLAEIQQIPLWEQWVKSLSELGDIKVFITTSNAALSDSVLSWIKVGGKQIKSHCFSFAEYAILNRISFDKKALTIDKQQIKLNILLEKYMSFGGFPEVLKSSDITIADRYFKDIIYIDIIAKHKIRNIKEIKDLALYLISNTGDLNSYANLRKIIAATNTTTIKNYMILLKDVFLIHSLPLYDYSVKKQIYNSNKYYVSDIGFYHAVGFSFVPDRSRLLENVVLIDLLRLSYDVYYWRSKKGYAVDFVIQRNKKISTAVQVCYHLNNENIVREVRGLVSARAELLAQELVIVSMDQNRTIHILQEDIDASQNHFGAKAPVDIKVVSYLNWIVELG